MDIVERLRDAWADYEGAGSLCNEAAAEIERLRAELLEQARIIGMSGERELALRAKVERLRAEAQRLRNALGRIEGYSEVNGMTRIRMRTIAHAALTETNHD